MNNTGSTAMARGQLQWLSLSGAVLVFDQLTKYWAEHILRYDVIPVFFWFDFSLVHNTGAAFGFLAGSGGWQHVFFVTLSVVISIALMVAMRRLAWFERHLGDAYALIIAGAIGNAIDRVIYQYVIDFIHWFYKDWHYPHFNIADSAIFIGAVLLIFEAFGKPFLNKQP